MKKQFIGQDGFIWWQGVVELRQDPLKLGRCKVRIFGWHKDNITDQPTDSLPWTYPVIPLDAGKNTIGPKEGDWVFGFFADAEIAQKPMMMGIIPGMNEQKAPDPAEQIGHQDLRPDEILQGHNQPYPAKFYDVIQNPDGSGTTITEYELKSRYPDDKLLREPETSRFARGFSNGIVLRTDAYDKDKEKTELKELSEDNPLNELLDPETKQIKDELKDLKLPTELTMEVRSKEDEPLIELGTIIFQNIDGDITTSEGRDAILRSNGYSAAGTVLWEQNGEIFLVDIFGEFKKGIVYAEDGTEYKVEHIIPQPMGHLYRSLLRPKILNTLQQKYKPIGEHLEAAGEFAAFDKNDGGSFSEPLSPYRTEYPYNHVYESESGHLLEFDDTPGFERIHLIHRSGTFEEIHPNGLKVSKTVNDDYRYYIKNEFKHTEGKVYHTIDKGMRILVNADEGADNHFTICVGEGSNLNITTAGGQVNIYSTKEVQVFADADVNVDCENAKIHTRADTIIHTEGDADWHVEGDMRLKVDGNFYQMVGIDKVTSVMNNYEKTVGVNYNSVAGSQILEVSGANNITQSTYNIIELSALSNIRTSALAIIDTSVTNSALTAAAKLRMTGGYAVDMSAESDLMMTVADLKFAASRVRIDGISLTVSGLDVKMSPFGMYLYGGLSISGFITSNGILHGTTYV